VLPLANDVHQGLCASSRRGVQEQFGFDIAYPGSSFIAAIENAVPDLPGQLIEHMISAKSECVTIDPKRMDHAHFESVEKGVKQAQMRVQFGWQIACQVNRSDGKLRAK